MAYVLPGQGYSGVPPPRVASTPTPRSSAFQNSSRTPHSHFGSSPILGQPVAHVARVGGPPPTVKRLSQGGNLAGNVNGVSTPIEQSGFSGQALAARPRSPVALTRPASPLRINSATPIKLGNTPGYAEASASSPLMRTPRLSQAPRVINVTKLGAAQADVSAPRVIRASPVAIKSPIISGAVRQEAKDTQLEKLRKLLKVDDRFSEYADQLFAKYDVFEVSSLSLERLIPLVDELQENYGVNPGDPGPDREKALTRLIMKYGLRWRGGLAKEEFRTVLKRLLFQRLEALAPVPIAREKLIKQMNVSPTAKYSTKKKLGEGSFGIAYLVEDKKTHNARVMKVVDKAKAVQAGTPLEMIEEEIHALQLLDHPNVLRLFEYYMGDKEVFFIVDIIPDGELYDVVKDAVQKRAGVYLEEDWIRRLMRQVLHGVCYCHNKGVMHKDLKLENIMLRDKAAPDAVIIDMGVAELFGSTHRKSDRCQHLGGTLSTMAPEVMQGDFSYKCDIWSLGCVLFSLFCEKIQYVPDGKGGQVLYPYPFGPPMGTQYDPMGMGSLRAEQMRGPNLTKVLHASRPAKSLISDMLILQEHRRPKASTCLQHSFFAADPLSHHECHVSQAQVEYLANHHEVDSWRRAVLMEAATQLPVGKLASLQEEFAAMDANNDGVVSKSELVAALTEAGMAEKIAQQCAEAADADGSGTIEFSEFCAMMLPADENSQAFESALREAFDAVDTSGDGYITKSEVLSMLRGGKLDKIRQPNIVKTVSDDDVQMGHTFSMKNKAAELMLEMMSNPHGDGEGVPDKVSFDIFKSYFVED